MSAPGIRPHIKKESKMNIANRIAMRKVAVAAVVLALAGAAAAITRKRAMR